MKGKKAMKRIAAMLCAIMLVTGMSPGVIAKADAIKDFWDNVEKKFPTQTEAAISPVTINPGETAKVMKTYTLNKGNVVLSVPVIIGDSPQVFVKITLRGITQMSPVKVGGLSTWNEKDGDTTYFTLGQRNGKEQKMLILKDADDFEKDVKVEVTLYQYRTTASTQEILPAGRWAAGYNCKRSFLYKIKAPSDGIIQIESGSDPNMKEGTKLGLDTTLLNSKKKGISDAMVSGDGAQYCVKKGTYYLKASNSDGMVMFRYKFNKVKASKNIKQSKAVNIKKGKTVKGILPAGESKKGGRWYKIVIPKKRKVSITAKNLAGEGQKVYLYKKGKSKPIASGKKKLAYMGGNGKYAFKTRFPLDKGTYYLKVTKDDKEASVYYSVTWK